MESTLPAGFVQIDKALCHHHLTQLRLQNELQRHYICKARFEADHLGSYSDLKMSDWCASIITPSFMVAIGGFCLVWGFVVWLIFLTIGAVK